MPDIKKLLFDFASIMTVSGYENRGAEQVKALIGDWFDEYSSDCVGNQIFIKRCGKPDAHKLLIDAHIDEIGMIVTEIKDGGFIRVTKNGGIDTRIMMASEVIIYAKEPIFGVVASMPPHLQKKDDNRILPAIEELLIDTGYSKEELEKLVSLGTPVGFKPIQTELLNNNIVSKGFDDKSCAALAAYSVSLLKDADIDWDIYLLLSVREEFSMLGAKVGAYTIKPDAAFVIDVNFGSAPDLPKLKTIKMGDGVSVSLSVITDRSLTKAIVDFAAKNELKCQTIVEISNTGTNANTIGITGAGIPTAVISLPLRNMHTSAEVICTDDVESGAKLISEFIKGGLTAWFKA